MQFAIHDKHAAPHDMAGFADAFECAAAEAKIHWRLTFAHGTFPTAGEMRGRRRAGNKKDPHVIIHAVTGVMLSPTEVVKRVLRSKTEFAPKAVGDETIQPGTL